VKNPAKKIPGKHAQKKSRKTTFDDRSGDNNSNDKSVPVTKTSPNQTPGNSISGIPVFSGIHGTPGNSSTGIPAVNRPPISTFPSVQVPAGQALYTIRQPAQTLAQKKDSLATNYPLYVIQPQQQQQQQPAYIYATVPGSGNPIILQQQQQQQQLPPPPAYPGKKN